MDTIHQILNALDSARGESVLATIIRVDGSAYRKEGTMMLFQEGGSKVGVLSGGCLEEDLYERIIQLPDECSSQLYSYDMSSEDDLSWGQGAGCNGVLHVLLERIDSRLQLMLFKVKNTLQQGRAVTIVKTLDSMNQVTACLFLTESEVFGDWKNDLTAHQRQHFLNVAKTAFMKNGEGSYFIQRLEPKPRLILFGAGKDTVPIAKLASSVGFTVIVSDWRPSLCNRVFFPKADEWIVGFPEEALGELSFRKTDTIVIATHHFQHDRLLLNGLFKAKVGYIGLLGSKKRTEKLLQGKVPPDHFFSPVGLPIGAEGPEEIAVSVIAEVLQHRNRVKETSVQKQMNR
jgi:xanthine/CO dehydrogenase XdhC/CoxF family maturation factor